jgi:fibronectin type 3 domain-containing protein
MTQQYAENLEKRKHVFIKATKTKKNVFTTMVSIHGAKTNEYYLSTVSNQLVEVDLFG